MIKQIVVCIDSFRLIWNDLEMIWQILIILSLSFFIHLEPYSLLLA